MSRIAGLEPPYAPEIQGQFDRIMRGAPPLMLFRVVAANARLGKIPSRRPFGPRPALDPGTRDRHRPDLRADRMRIRMGCACHDICASRRADRRADPRHRA